MHVQVTSKDKKKNTEDFLGPLAEERFALLVNLCKKISDFGHDASAAKDDGIDETYGIPVQFDNYEVKHYCIEFLKKNLTNFIPIIYNF